MSIFIFWYSDDKNNNLIQHERDLNSLVKSDFELFIKISVVHVIPGLEELFVELIIIINCYKHL